MSAIMYWERVEIKAKPRDENTHSGKSPGRKGGKLGPGKKWGHTLNAVNLGKQVYVFGGMGRTSGRQTTFLSTTLVSGTFSLPLLSCLTASVCAVETSKLLRGSESALLYDLHEARS